MNKVVIDNQTFIEHYQPNGEDDYDVEYVPSSYVDDDGIRHAVIFDQNLPEYMRLEKMDGEWKLIEKAPF